MRSLGVNFVEYDIDKDKERKDELRQRSGSTGVPAIDIEGTIIHGFDPGAIKAALDRNVK